MYLLKTINFEYYLKTPVPIKIVIKNIIIIIMIKIIKVSRRDKIINKILIM